MKPCFLLLLLTSFCIFSCQKELHTDVPQPGGSDTTVTVPEDDTAESLNSIKGAWNFVSLEANTKSINEVTVGSTVQKTITFLDWLTTENSGSVVIDDSAMTSTGIAYKILSTIKIYHYKNDNLIDSLEEPYVKTFPPTDSYSTYRMVAEDSIFFKKGGFSNFSSENFKGTPSPAKILLDGDKLSFIQEFQQDTIINILGIKHHTVEKINAVLNFKRK